MASIIIMAPTKPYGVANPSNKYFYGLYLLYSTRIIKTSILMGNNICTIFSAN